MSKCNDRYRLELRGVSHDVGDLWCYLEDNYNFIGEDAGIAHAICQGMDYRALGGIAVFQSQCPLDFIRMLSLLYPDMVFVLSVLAGQPSYSATSLIENGCITADEAVTVSCSSSYADIMQNSVMVNEKVLDAAEYYPHDQFFFGESESL